MSSKRSGVRPACCRCRYRYSAQNMAAISGTLHRLMKSDQTSGQANSSNRSDARSCARKNYHQAQVTRRVYRTNSGDREPRDPRANAVTTASRPAPSEVAKIVAGRGWPSHGALPKQRRGHNRWTASGRIRTGDRSACADANYSIRGSKLHAETHRVKARHEAGDGCQHQRPAPGIAFLASPVPSRQLGVTMAFAAVSPAPPIVATCQPTHAF